MQDQHDPKLRAVYIKLSPACSAAHQFEHANMVTEFTRQHTAKHGEMNLSLAISKMYHP